MACNVEQAVSTPDIDVPLNARFMLAFGLLSIALAFELFDFFIAGFLVSAVAPAWQLTFGQSGVVLLAAGLGAMFGALAGGLASDRIGRKPVLVIGAAVYPLAAAGISLIADGDWVAFALLRLIVGLGYGFAGVAQFALIVELAPRTRRTLLASASTIPIGVGFILAPAGMSLLYGPLGWRGLAAICLVPIVFSLLFFMFVPESPEWLAAKGRMEEARRAMRQLFGPSVDTASLPVAGSKAKGAGGPARGLLSYPREFTFCILAYGLTAAGTAGILLWGPLIVGQILGLPPAQTAGYFVLVSVSGLVGRFAFTALSQRWGRRPTGQLVGFAAAVTVALGAALPHADVWGMPLLLLSLIIGAFFFDGGLANLQPHAAEIFPVDLAGRGVAVSQAASSLGKILGPAVLALLAGTANVVMPAATQAAITPGFLTMAGFYAVAGLAFTFFGTETHVRVPRARSLKG